MEPKIWTTYSEIVFILFSKCLLVLFCRCFVLKRGLSVYPRPTLNSQSSSRSSLLCADSWTTPHLGLFVSLKKIKNKKTLRILCASEVAKSGYAVDECLEIPARHPAASTGRQARTYNPTMSSCTLIHELFSCVTCTHCFSPYEKNSLMKEA